MPRGKEPVQGTLEVQHKYNLRPRVKCEEQQQCMICLDTRRFKKREKCSCGHSFHENCINEWLKTNVCCPVCRQPLKSVPRQKEQPHQEQRHLLQQQLRGIDREQELLLKQYDLLRQNSQLVQMREELLNIENHRIPIIELQSLVRSQHPNVRFFDDRVTFFNQYVDLVNQEATNLKRQHQLLSEQKRYLNQQIQNLEQQSSL